MDSEDDHFYDAEDDLEDWKGPNPAESTGPAEQPCVVAAAATDDVPAVAGVPGADAAVAVPPASPPAAIEAPQEPFPLHRAAWNGQVELVKRLAAGMSREAFKAYDSQGNTALHVAVMRRQREVVEALLAAGCPAGPRNARGWVPLLEAVELGDRPLALKVARAEVEQMRQAVKAKKAALLALLRTELPDFSLQLKWELGSSMPGVGALVRRYAPHDTYTLWKKGGRIRVDGTLMGLDEGAETLVPSFKRGHFSLLYDASGDKARALFVNHTNKTYIDVKAARKKVEGGGGGGGAAADGVLETEVDMLMASEVLQHKKLRSVDFRFKPVSGWLTKEVREKVEGWNCKLYEAAGRLIAVTRYKMPYGLTSDMSYDYYLATSFEPDPVVESPVNPMNPASLKDRGSNPAKAAAKLAVAANHQRIAAAQAAAKNEEAARVATAAAARAAAGGLRALAPPVEEEGEDDDDDGDDGGEDGKGKAGAAGSSGDKAAEKEDSGGRGEGAGGKLPLERLSAAKGGPAEEVEGGGARGDAAAEPAGAGALGGGGGRGGNGADDGASALDLDLTALAARAAADAAAVRAAGGDEEAEEDGDGDGDAALEGGATALLNGSAEGRRESERMGSLVSDSAADWQGAGRAGSSGKGAGARAAGGGGSGKGGKGSAAGGSSGKSWWRFRKGASGGSDATAAAEAAGAGDGGGGGGGGGVAAGGASSESGGDGGGAAAKKSRKISGRCWMAESFPLSLTQLLPLLEVVGTANKAFAKVARFMRKYGDLAMFPVKVHVPLVLTVYMLLSFKQFKLMGSGPQQLPPPDDAFFEVPPGYKEGNVDKFAKFAEAAGGPTASRTPNSNPNQACKPSGEDHAEGKAKGPAGGSNGAAPNGGSKKKGRRERGGGSEDGTAQLSLLQGDVMDDELGLGGGLLGGDD